MNTTFLSVLDSLAEAKGPATLWLEANSEVIAKWKLEDDVAIEPLDGDEK